MENTSGRHYELIGKVSETIKRHYEADSNGQTSLAPAKKPRAKSTKPPTEKQVASRAKFGEISKSRAAEINQHRAANPGLSYKEARAVVYKKYAKSSQPPAQPEIAAPANNQPINN